VLAKIKRIAKIVVEESGVKTGWWLLASALPAANDWASKTLGKSVTSVLPDWFPEPSWTWGLAVLAVWVIVSLARRILVHETATLEIEIIRDRRDNSVWLEVRNCGSKALENCAVDFEKIENASGERVFPHSFGLIRPGGLSNPFPLKATQPKQGKFAELKDGNITIFGMTVDRKPSAIVLVLEKYTVTVGAYSEAEGAQLKKVFTLSREDGVLNVS